MGAVAEECVVIAFKSWSGQGLSWVRLGMAPISPAAHGLTSLLTPVYGLLEQWLRSV